MGGNGLRSRPMAGFGINSFEPCAAVMFLKRSENDRISFNVLSIKPHHQLQLHSVSSTGYRYERTLFKFKLRVFRKRLRHGRFIRTLMTGSGCRLQPGYLKTV